jgi:lipoprotein NlpI
MSAKSTSGVLAALVTAATFTIGIFWAHPAMSDGALAIGLPSDVVKSGYASGFSYNAKTKEDAQRVALEYCRKAAAPARTTSLCKVIETFTDRCVALSMDPKAGTPGVGWAVADDLRGAEREALSKCEATAGRGRRAACVVTQSNCDGRQNAANRCEKLSGDPAIAACDEAIQQNPKSAVNFNNRGFEYRRKGDNDKALADFNKALELDPKYAVAYNGRGALYRDIGDMGRAFTDFNKAIDANPKYDLAYLNRALTYFYRGDSDKALADFNQTVELDPKNASYVLWLDIANKRSKLPSRLEAATTQVDMTRWPAPVIRFFLGQLTPGAVLAAADDTDAEVKNAQICDANFFTGELALQQGTKDEAARLFRMAAANCPRGRVARIGANAELKALGMTP